jgi:predicted MFS family arabinose efflux permease
VSLRAGAHRYARLLSLPGARAPVLASTFGSLPIGMYGLAILLLARDATGSFAEAGRVVGAFGLANAIGAVAQGRLMDRLTQPRVLRVAATGHVLALAALLVAAGRDAPTWVLALCATAAGLCLPQLPAAMRSLWGTLVHDEPSRQAAYALVTIVFEVAVMVAPVLVAAIVAVASPSAAVAVAAAVGGGAAFAFAGTGGSRAWRGTPHDVGWLGPLVAPGMRTLFVVMVAFGAGIGIIQVAVPAFAEAHGTPATAGLLLAAVSFGSLAGGVVYGARDWPGTPPWRLVVLLLVLGGLYALLAAATTPWVLGGLLVLPGLLLAPTNVVSSTLLDTVAPPGTVTEAFSVTVMAIVTGIAVGNAAGGLIVDASSYAVAVLCSAAAALLAAATALLRRHSLTGRIAPAGR